MPAPVYTRLNAAMKICRRAVPARLRDGLRQWMVQWLDLRWQTRSLVRLRVEHYSQWIIYNEIFVNGEYDEALALALDAPRETLSPLHIVDLGANVGFFTLRAFDRLLDRGGTRDRLSVTAFEANPGFAGDFASRVLVDNGLGSRVRLVRGLVGARRGAAVLYHDSVHPQSGRAGVPVPYVDLSAELADVPRVDLLKCDIEGSEERFIENYPDVLGKTGVAVFELHRDMCDTERCRAMLREYGFARATTLREGQHVSIHTVWR
jgi:FkbM family methyltransferase